MITAVLIISILIIELFFFSERRFLSDLFCVCVWTISIRNNANNNNYGLFRGSCSYSLAGCFRFIRETSQAICGHLFTHRLYNFCDLHHLWKCNCICSLHNQTTLCFHELTISTKNFLRRMLCHRQTLFADSYQTLYCYSNNL